MSDPSSEFDDTPPRGSASVAVAVAAVATLAVVTIRPSLAIVAAVGVAVLAAGAFRGSRTLVTAGAAAVFAADLVAAFSGLGTEVFAALTGGALAVAAWDIAEHGVGLGEHVGSAARTRQGETVHAALTLTVAVVAIAVGYVVYLLGAEERPMVAIVALAAGALVLFGAFSD